MDDRNTLLAEIDRISFSIDDLILYLDTHPGDSEALECFQTLQEKRQDALQEFEQAYYPLTVDSIQDSAEERWSWGDAPAPWEVDANVEL